MTSLVFPIREMPTHTITLSPPKAVTILVKQSAHFDPTVQLPRIEFGLITDNVPPDVQIPGHILLTQVQTGLMVKGSHGRLPGSPAILNIIFYSLLWVVWVESRRPANLKCKSIEDCLRFLSADRLRKWSFCGVGPSVFLAC